MRVLGSLTLSLSIVFASAALAAAASLPWNMAQQVLEATRTDAQTNGIRAIEKHVPDLEKELKTAMPANQAMKIDGKTYVLSDGASAALGGLTLALVAAKKNKDSEEVISISDPYPTISLYLGSYYNEIGQPNDAVRVLDAGIAVSDIDGLFLGETTSVLLSEKGSALNALKRFDDALATYNKGLKLSGLEDVNRARLYRGRGFALTELGKLDDAARAYRDSLTCEPGNQRAENELRYIAELRAGAPSAPSGIAIVAPTDPNAPRTGKCATE